MNHAVFVLEQPRIERVLHLSTRSALQLAPGLRLDSAGPTHEDHDHPQGVRRDAVLRAILPQVEDVGEHPHRGIARGVSEEDLGHRALQAPPVRRARRESIPQLVQHATTALVLAIEVQLLRLAEGIECQTEVDWELSPSVRGQQATSLLHLLGEWACTRAESQDQQEGRPKHHLRV